MRYKTRNHYQEQIIRMIAEGYSNREIWEKVGCNQKYPTVIRRQLNDMDVDERDRLFAEVLGKQEEKKVESAPVKKGISTPYKMAKGRPYISRY